MRQTITFFKTNKKNYWRYSDKEKMNKKCVNTTPVIHTDFDSAFAEEIDLKNLILPADNNVKILDVVINQVYWDLAEGVHTTIKPILIIAKQSCSIISRAIHNSLGNLSYQEFSCELIGRGGRLIEDFENTYEFSTVHLSDLQKIPYIYHQALLHVLQDGICVEPQQTFFWGQNNQIVNGLVILSGSEDAPIISPISKNIDTVIKIGNYTFENIIQILNQRADFYKLEFEDKEQSFKAIAQATRCNVREAIDVLLWAYRACRSEGRFSIGLKDLNTIFLYKRGLG